MTPESTFKEISTKYSMEIKRGAQVLERQECGL